MQNKLDLATRQSFSEAEISNSRDFVRVVMDLFREHRPAIADSLEPIYQIEVDNPGADSTANICHSIEVMKIDGLRRAHAIVRAYRSLLDFLLLDDVISDLYPMDKKDLVGWKIYKEIDAKYAYANRKLREYEYVDKRNSGR